VKLLNLLNIKEFEFQHCNVPLITRSRYSYSLSREDGGTVQFGLRNVILNISRMMYSVPKSVIVLLTNWET
jgi:hypothetical protein